MRIYKVNKIEHTVFDSIEEVPDNITYKKDWRNAEVNDWVLTDDECIIQILRKGSMKGRVCPNNYLGTCTGTFLASKDIKMDTSKRINIYSFGGNSFGDERLEEREELNRREELFVHYWITERMHPQEAYIKAFPTNNPSYASMKAAKLIGTKRVTTKMNEKLRPVLEDLSINDRLVLKNIKALATEGSKEETRLKALFKLSDILDLEDKTKTSVQQISGAVFQGFSKEKLESVEREVLEAAEELEDDE
jgi:hypothetical protein